jgi:hypothetical protein
MPVPPPPLPPLLSSAGRCRHKALCSVPSPLPRRAAPSPSSTPTLVLPCVALSHSYKSPAVAPPRAPAHPSPMYKPACVALGGMVPLPSPVPPPPTAHRAAARAPAPAAPPPAARAAPPSPPAPPSPTPAAAAAAANWATSGATPVNLWHLTQALTRALWEEEEEEEEEVEVEGEWEREKKWGATRTPTAKPL